MSEDIEAARSNLHALLGPMILRPRDGDLWAHPSPNAKGLVETRPLDGLRTNSALSGSGGALCTLARSQKSLVALDVPLIAA